MKSWLLAGFIICLLLIPGLTFAQFTGPIVPQCGGIAGGDCSTCDLTRLAQNIINILVYLAGAFATIMFAYAGLKYTTSATNPAEIETAHKIFWNVLLGFIFVLAAWLIIDTVMKAFYKSDSKFGPWNEILCRGSASPIGPSGGSSQIQGSGRLEAVPAPENMPPF